MKTRVLAAALAAACVLPVTNVSAAIATNDGTPVTVLGLTGFSTFGDDMAGMLVTAYSNSFTGGSQTLTWGATSSTGGGVTGTGWALSQSGDTFDSAWLLTSDIPLTGLTIDAIPGNTVFDRTSPNPGTPGSASGRDFDPNSGLLVTYRNVVNVLGETALRDLWGLLDIDFDDPFGGTDGLARFSFRQDTDSIAAVPVPAALPLLLSGLIGLGVITRRRKVAAG